MFYVKMQKCHTFVICFRTTIGKVSPHFPYQPCRACRNQQQNYLM